MHYTKVKTENITDIYPEFAYLTPDGTQVFVDDRETLPSAIECQENSVMISRAYDTLSGLRPTGFQPLVQFRVEGDTLILTGVHITVGGAVVQPPVD